MTEKPTIVFESTNPLNTKGILRKIFSTTGIEIDCQNCILKGRYICTGFTQNGVASIKTTDGTIEENLTKSETPCLEFFQKN